MSQVSQPIRVYSSASPQYRQFHINQFKTMNSFQQKLQEWFQISIDNQKIIHNGKILKVRGQTPFKQLQFNKQSVLRVLTIAPETEMPIKQVQEIKQQIAEQIEPKQNIIEPIVEIKMQQVIKEPQEYKQIYSPYLLKQSTINHLISTLISSMKIENKQLLIINQPKLKYILAKLSSANLPLQKFLFQKIDLINLALINVEEIEAKRQIEPTYIGQQLIDLQTLGFQEQNIIKALQLSRNNIEIALEILDKNKFQQYIFQFPELKTQTLVDEYQSIYNWLIQAKNENHVKLMKCSQKYLQTYLNYLKKACPGLFKIMVRWYPYLRPLILSINNPSQALPQ